MGTETIMRDHQHAACKALAAADVGAVEVLGASSDSTVPPFNTTRRKEEVMTRDIHHEVTNSIIAELKTGARPWVKPWSETPGLNIPANAVSGRPYSGVNTL